MAITSTQFSSHKTWLQDVINVSSPIQNQLTKNLKNHLHENLIPFSTQSMGLWYRELKDIFMHGRSDWGDVKIAATCVFYLRGPNSTVTRYRIYWDFLGVRASEQVAHDFDWVPLMKVIVWYCWHTYLWLHVVVSHQCPLDIHSPLSGQVRSDTWLRCWLYYDSQRWIIISDLAGSMAFDWTLFFLIFDTIRETFFGIKAKVNTGYFCHNSIFSLWNDMQLITLKSYVNNI